MDFHAARRHSAFSEIKRAAPTKCVRAETRSTAQNNSLRAPPLAKLGLRWAKMQLDSKCKESNACGGPRGAPAAPHGLRGLSDANIRGDRAHSGPPKRDCARRPLGASRHQCGFWSPSWSRGQSIANARLLDRACGFFQRRPASDQTGVRRPVGSLRAPHKPKL